MPTKIIISYDGTANEEDAIALGRTFGRAGADLSVAYVRHAAEGDTAAEQHAQAEAQEVLERGIGLLGIPHAGSHVVIDRSTPHGLARLAAAEGADVVIFCSDSHTAKGQVSIGNSAQALLEGGPCAVAIAPAGLAERSDALRGIVAVADGDGGATATADEIAAALGAEVKPVIDDTTDLVVIDSRADAAPGTVSLSSSAAHLIEIVRAATVVLPRGKTLSFSAAATPGA
ncbi:MAG TPA: universal stress protein [Solirubrobacteraceae bacterium]|nr:universal stress protein [Solirubrobacteraceae bacterium]